MEEYLTESVVFGCADNEATLKELADNEGASDASAFFYQPLKKEQVSAKKQVVLVDEKDEKSYLLEASQLPKLFKGVKIPGQLLSVPGYGLFVQSTSHNRKIQEGQKVAFLQDGAGKKRPKTSVNAKAMRAFFEKVRASLPAETVGKSFQERFGDNYTSDPNIQMLYQVMNSKGRKGEEDGDEDEGDGEEGVSLALKPKWHRKSKLPDYRNFKEEFDGDREEIDPEDLKAERLGCTKWGGVPHLPDSLLYLEKRVAKMFFVCQWDLSIVAKWDVRGLLPTTGFLYFWHDLRESEPPVVVHYDGPRESLKPANFAEKKNSMIKNLLFVVGLADESESLAVAPSFFDRTVLDECEGDIYTGNKMVKGLLTFLAIKKFRPEAEISKALNKDMFVHIAKMIFDAEKENYKNEEMIEAAPEGSIALFSMGGGGECIANPGTCYMFCPFMSADDLRKRWFGKCLAVATED